jgi:hypothetical protein
MMLVRPEPDSGGSAVHSVAGDAVSRWDRLGVCASVACAFHCLAAPLLFLAAPTFAGIWAHPSSHALIGLLVLPLAGTVLIRGYCVHRKLWVATAAVFGIACILLGSVLPFLEGETAACAAETCTSCCPRIVPDGAGGFTFGWPSASLATIAGSALLVACHLGNLAYCRCCGAPPSTGWRCPTR